MPKLKYHCVVLTLMLISGMRTFAQEKNEEKRYTRVDAGYLMVLQQGDNIMDELEKFSMVEHIPSANFTGMGFVNITFGFYNVQTKGYKPKTFEGVELASMHGTIANTKGKPSIHAHGVIGDNNFQARAGHILQAMVSTGSVEIFLIVHDKPFERELDEKTGAEMLRIR
jgi:predicted DNA-binding protein with PD1-like motif